MNTKALLKGIIVFLCNKRPHLCTLPHVILLYSLLRGITFSIDEKSNQKNLVPSRELRFVAILYSVQDLKLFKTIF